MSAATPAGRWSSPAHDFIEIALIAPTCGLPHPRTVAGMSSVTMSALSGMQAATRRFADAAVRIAGPHSQDRAADIVDLLSARRDFEANLLVLRAEADMMDRLLDIKA
jgi:hypothetical protein